MGLENSLFLHLAMPVKDGDEVAFQMTKTEARPERDRPDRSYAMVPEADGLGVESCSEGFDTGVPPKNLLTLLTKTKAEPERDRPDRL